MYFDFDPGSGHYIILYQILQLWILNISDLLIQTFHAERNITAFSTTVGSDRRPKTNIHKIKYGLKDILKLNW